MTERLPPVPDRAKFPDLSDKYVRTLPAGTRMSRIYFAGGEYPAVWNRFRANGPTKARFDHQPPPPKIHPKRRVAYCTPTTYGPDGEPYPSMKVCLAECFRDKGAVDLQRDDPYFTVFDTTRPLVLLDVSDTDWVTDAGGNSALTSGVRGSARNWARAIYRTYTAVDGIFYAPSNVPVARACALWERAEAAVPDRPLLNDPLDHMDHRGSIETYAFDMHLDLV